MRRCGPRTLLLLWGIISCCLGGHPTWAVSPQPVAPPAYPKRDLVTYNDAELSAAVPPAKQIYVRGFRLTPISPGPPPPPAPCTRYPQLIKKATLHVVFDLGEDYNFGGNEFSTTANIKIVGYTSYEGPTGEVTTYDVDPLTIEEHPCPTPPCPTRPCPEKHFVVDFTALHSQINRFSVMIETPGGYVRDPSPYVRANVRLRIYIEEEFRVAVPDESAGPDYRVKVNKVASWPPMHPLAPQNPVTFTWKSPCASIQDYEIQILRLYNRDPLLDDHDERINTTVDWNQAMSLETESPALSITLTLAQGTGFYLWRIRPIGNYWPGGISDPRNWGPWSEAPAQGTTFTEALAHLDYAFFFKQFDDDRNWIYSRTFTEGARISEQMTYANGLQQVVQNQAHLQSRDSVLVTQTRLDFSGRPSFVSMAGPSEPGVLGYREQFLLQNGDLYTARHFDAGSTFDSPRPVDGGPLRDFYSSDNPDRTIPSAEGYPFTRTLYYGDGTSRVKEQSGVGAALRLQPAGAGHTIKTFYSGIADEELVRVFGDEAPSDTSVYKIINLDANGVATVSYVAKEGQTIATCLAKQAPHPSLDDLPSGETAGFTVQDTIKGRTRYGDYGISSSKTLTFVTDTEVTFKYKLFQEDFEDLCTGYEDSCDYRVEFLVFSKDTLAVMHKVSRSLAPNDIHWVNAEWDTSFTITLKPGSYVFEKRVVSNTLFPNPPPGQPSETYLEKHMQAVRESLETASAESLRIVFAYIDSVLFGKTNPCAYMDSLYFYLLGVHIDTLSYADTIFADSSTFVDLGCDSIEIPIKACPVRNCPNGQPDFEKTLLDRWEHSPGSFGADLAKYFEVERAKNRFFATDLGGWEESGGSGWRHSQGQGGSALFVSLAPATLVQKGRLKVGAKYNVSFRVVFSAGDRVGISLGTTFLGYETATGSYSYTAVCAGNEDISIAADPSGAFGLLAIDDVSVREVTYETGEFNQMVAGMLASGRDPSGNPYRCQDLWKCWEAAVEADSMMREMAKLQTEVSYSLLEQFLGCEGAQRVPKCFTTVAFGATEGYLSHAYECFYYDDVNNPNLSCEIMTCDTPTCVTQATWPGLTLEQRNDFYLCIQNARPDTVMSPAASNQQLRGKCEDVCEWRRDGFVRALTQMYHDAFIYVEGDTRELVEDRTWGMIYTPTGPPLVGPLPRPNVSLEHIECQAKGLVELCKQGCDLTVFQSGSPAHVDSVGSPTELDTLKMVMTYAYKLQLPDTCKKELCCPEGFVGSGRTDGDLVVGENLFDLADQGTMEASIEGMEKIPDGPLGLSGVSHVTAMGRSYRRTFLSARSLEVDHAFSHGEETAGPVDSIFVFADYEWPAAGRMYHVSAEVYVDLIRWTEQKTPQPDPQLPRVSLEIGVDGIDLSSTTREAWVSGADPQGEWKTLESVVQVGAAPEGPLGFRLAIARPDREKEEAFPDSVRYFIDNFRALAMDTVGCNGLCLQWVDPRLQVPDSLVTTFEADCCAKANARVVQSHVYEMVAKYIDTQLEKFKKLYLATCADPGNIRDEWVLCYPLGYHHYTLYGHDRAGNVVWTVPPEGVNLGLAANSLDSRAEHPEYPLATEYEYNSLKQLVAQRTPDADSSSFWYNDLGQLRFSENAKQQEAGSWSYTKYDAIARIIEVGQGGGDPAFYTHVGAPQYPSSGSQKTVTEYSRATPGVSYLGEPQRFLQNRVSSAYVISSEDDTTFTFYSYDPHGNAVWVAQDVPGLGRNYVGYKYDLLSKRVLEVAYNETRPDQFFHRYAYDADSRLIQVETSTNRILWEKDGRYEYNVHGPLKRLVMGEDKVQGVDYVYTLQGWLKSINHASLKPNKDPGGDDLGESTVARDVWGMQLGYYTGDFTHTGASPNPFSRDDATNLDPEFDLFNGNIASWSYRTGFKAGGRHVYEDVLVGNQYQYDLLNRVKHSWFSYYPDRAPAWVDTADYETSYEYDGNGNIRKLVRNAFGLKQLAMDSLTYHYTDLPVTNRLRRVTDFVASSFYEEDLDDQSVPSNYQYDRIGNLTKDVAGGLDTLLWNVYGKIEQIEKTNGTKVKFIYDAQGNRVAKQVKDWPRSASDTSTFYVRDASGNAMAIYERIDTEGVPACGPQLEAVYRLVEEPIYGSQRLGERREEVELATLCFASGARPRIPDPSVTHIWADRNMLFQADRNPPPLLREPGGGVVSGPGPIYGPFPIYDGAVKDLVFPAGGARIDGFAGVFSAGLNTASVEDAQGKLVLGGAGVRQAYYEVSPALRAGAAASGNSNAYVVYDVHEGHVRPMWGTWQIRADWQGRSVFIKRPGRDSQYYLFTVNRDDGRAYYHVIDLDAPGFGSKAKPRGAVTQANIPLDQEGYAYNRHLGVYEDLVGSGLSRVYLMRSDGRQGELISAPITHDGVGGPQRMARIENWLSDGDIAISEDGMRMAVTSTSRPGPSSPLVGDIWLFTLSADHGVFEAGTVSPFLSESAPYPGAAISSVAFSPSDRYLYFIKRTVGSPGGEALYRADLSTGGSQLLAALGGDIRRGANDSLYVATPGDQGLTWIAEQPHGPGWLGGSLDIGGSLKATGGLPVQKHRLEPLSQADGTAAAQMCRSLPVRAYEIGDHLNNVNVVLSELKNGEDVVPDPVGAPDRYLANEIASAHYYPYGMEHPDRSHNASDYRYAFNGKEATNELVGDTPSLYDYGERFYDSRLSRFHGVDPLQKDYPWYSSYQFAGGKALWARDVDGEEEFLATDFYNAAGTLYKTQITIIAPMHDAGRVNAFQKVHRSEVRYDARGNATVTYVGSQTNSDGSVSNPFRDNVERLAVLGALPTVTPGTGTGTSFQPNMQGNAFTVVQTSPGVGSTTYPDATNSITLSYGAATGPNPATSAYLPNGINAVPVNFTGRVDQTTGQVVGGTIARDAPLAGGTAGTVTTVNNVASQSTYGTATPAGGFSVTINSTVQPPTPAAAPSTRAAENPVGNNASQAAIQNFMNNPR